MIQVRPAAERGKTKTSWLDSHHTFSFGRYQDPRYMGFRTLRVINEDYVTPGAGFGTHSHSDMEILSYVIEGKLAHRDSSGGDGVIRAGEWQRMTAGSGISHSEFNASKTEPFYKSGFSRKATALHRVTNRKNSRLPANRANYDW